MSIRQQRPLISIVIPAFNEAERLPRTVAETLGHCDSRSYSAEVVIVDDGSADGTPGAMAVAAELDLRVRTHRLPSNLGKGAAVKAGVRMASGTYIIFMDADLSYPLHHIDDILMGFDDGYQVVIGSRSHPAARAERHAPISRRVASALLRAVVSLLGVSSYADTQCGLKGFTREAAEQLFSRQRIAGFAFDLELLYIARRLNIPVREVPVTLTSDHASRIRLLRDGLSFISDVQAMLWRGMRGAYDMPFRRSDDAQEGRGEITGLLDRWSRRN